MNRLETRLETERKLINKWRIIAAVWLFSGIAGLSAGPEEGIDYVLFCIVGFIGVGIWGLWRTHLKLERIKNIRKYAQVLANEPTGDLESIASRIGMNSEKVKEELTDILYRGYFRNAHINNKTNCIVICDKENGIVTGQTFISVDIEVVTCKHCTAINKVPKGMAKMCDYCKMPIQG